MTIRKPMIKETVGAAYYSFNEPLENSGTFDPQTYGTVYKSPVIKSIGKSEETDAVGVRSSGIEYDTVSKIVSLDIAMEVVAFHPDDLAKARGEIVNENGSVLAGGETERPFMALGFPVVKRGGVVKLEWFPKCKLIENTDDIATSEESFSEQNDTLTFKAYAFNDAGNTSFYVNTESEKAPKLLTQEKFFTAPILTSEQLDTIIADLGV